MQIFVKEPVHGRTLVFHCKETTTLEDLLQWIEDTTGIPERFYYITRHTKYISKSTPEERAKTLVDLGIQTEQTIQVNGRLHVNTPSKKLSTTA